MSALKEILAHYGMPKENIDDAITQIAQGYGACRYLEGVNDGAEAVIEQMTKAPKAAKPRLPQLRTLDLSTKTPEQAEAFICSLGALAYDTD